MVDATNGVGPLGNQQFSTKGVKLSDLKEKNQLLFNYFKQAGLNENSYVYSTDIEKLKEAYDKNDNGKLSKKEARAIFGEDVSRKDIKKALKAIDEIALTDLQGENFYPVKTNENETEYYTKNNVLVSSVYEDSEQHIQNYYGENKQVVAQFVQKKNEDGTMTKVSSTMNQYNDDGSLYSCSEKTYGDDGAFEEVKMTFLNGDQNKPLKIEHNVNGNKKTTDIEYNNEGKRMRSVSVANGQKTEVAYDELERPFKQFESPLGSDNMTINEYKYNGIETTPSEITTTKPDGSKERVTYNNGEFVSREQIVQLNPEDIKSQAKQQTHPVKGQPTQKVHVPDDWGRVPTSFRHSSGIVEAKDVDAALKALLDARNIKAADVDADKLKADLIKFNPSLFDKAGKLKADAKWDRLDLPKDLKAQYGKTPAGKDEAKPENPVPRTNTPIDSSLPGIPDPKARFNPRNGVGQAGSAQPVEQPKEEPKGEELDIPQKGPDLSKPVSKYGMNFLLPQKKYANQTVLNPDGTSYSYDENGYINVQYDKNGREILKVDRNPDNSVYYYIEYKLDANGNKTSEIKRKSDGSVDYYIDYVYNKKGEVAAQIYRNSDGTIDGDVNYIN